MDAIDTVLDSMPSLNGMDANMGQFKFAVGAIKADRVNFLAFDCVKQELSGDYLFNFKLELLEQVSPSDLIGMPARFEMIWQDENIFVHGVVSEVTSIGKRVDGEEVLLVLRSPLHPFKFNIQNRVFLNKDIPQLIEGILLDSGFEPSNFVFKTKGTYPVREFTVQYEESDYDFITRFMAKYGLFYTFEQTNEQALLVIYDDIADVPTLKNGGELLYEPLSGSNRQTESIFSFNRKVDLLTDSVNLKDYNYRTPEANISASTQQSTNVGGAGNDYSYGENYKTLDDGNELAQTRQISYDWQRETFVAESDCRGLVPGLKFTFYNHPNDELNGDYVIIGVEETGDQGAAQARGDNVSGLTYYNKLLLIRGGVPFTPKSIDDKYVHGVFTAVVETTGGDYAYLDEQGRYRIRMPFDQSATSAGEASHPVRQVQTYSGSEYGMHFPLHAGTEVVVTCVNGDVDRPILLGALHNPDNPGLVTSNNNSQNILRSWADNELFMEDKINEEQIDLFTKEKKNILTLDANSQGHKVTLSTAEGEMEFYCARSMLIESGDTHTVQSGNDHILYVENAQSITTKNKEIEFKAATDIRKKAGMNVNLHTETQNIEVQAGKDMVVDVMDNMSLEVRNDNLNIIVTSGNFEIKAAKAITVKGQGGGPIHIGQSGGKVEIAAGGAITIQGKTINVDGSNVYLKGATVKQGGGGSAGSAAANTSAINLSALNISSLQAWVENPLEQAENITNDIVAKTGSTEAEKYTTGAYAGENVVYDHTNLPLPPADGKVDRFFELQALDEETGIPIANADYYLIYDDETFLTGKTNTEGFIKVANPPNDSYHLVVEHYESTSASDDSSIGDTAYVDIEDEFEVELEISSEQRLIPLHPDSGNAASVFQGSNIKFDIKITSVNSAFDALSGFIAFRKNGEIVSKRDLSDEEMKLGRRTIGWDGYHNNIFDSKNLVGDWAKDKFDIFVEITGGSETKQSVVKLDTVPTQANWVETKVDLNNMTIINHVYLNMQNSGDASDSDFNRLVGLAIEGIEHYWSREIDVDGKRYMENVRVLQRENNAIDVNLIVEKGSYSRSHNTSILDARFVYNEGYFKNKSDADADYKRICAHEFGHSVLYAFGGPDMSYSHKGSTHIIPQSVKESTAGYPSSGEIDLMKYYNTDKNNLPDKLINKNTIASEEDVRKLVCASQITYSLFYDDESEA